MTVIVSIFAAFLLAAWVALTGGELLALPLADWWNRRQARRRKPGEAYARAVVIAPFVAIPDHERLCGKVRMRGEIWSAQWCGSSEPAAVDAEVVVVSRDGLRLEVSEAA